jgi:hypothetical protein
MSYGLEKFCNDLTCRSGTAGLESTRQVQAWQVGRAWHERDAGQARGCAGPVLSIAARPDDAWHVVQARPDLRRRVGACPGWASRSRVR